MHARRGALLGWAVAIAVAVVATAAGVDALTGSSGGEDAAPARAGEAVLRGPDVPAPGALPGRLLVADAGSCRLRVLDLATLTLGRSGPRTSCRIWVAPSGEHAVVTRAGREDGRSQQELWLVRLDDPPRYERRLGPARAAPAWSPDGTLVAWCRDDGVSLALDLAAGTERVHPGCFPQIVAGGAVVTREREGRATAVRDDGGLLLGEQDLAEAFGDDGVGGSVVRVFASGVSRDGALVLGVSRGGGPFGGQAAIGTWQGSELVGSVRLPMPYAPGAIFFGLRIEPSPDGTAAALLFPEALFGERGDDLAALVDLRSGRLDTRLAETRYGGFAWSPDGGWLALSNGAEILIYGATTTDPVYVLPLAARAVGWLSSPGGG